MNARSRKSFYQEVISPAYEAVSSSPIAQRYLSAKRVVYNGVVLSGQGALLGNRYFEDLDFCRLFMIFNGADAWDALHTNASRRNAPRGRYVRSEARGIALDEVAVGLYKRNILDFWSRSVFMHHLRLEKELTKSMIGTVAISLSLMTSFKLGFKSVRAKAAGGYDPIAGRPPNENYVGFEVCPKLGFDAPLFPFEMKDPDFRCCRTVQDVRKLHPGVWEDKGFGRYMSFDMSPGSQSWEILLAYLKSKQFNF